MKVELNVIVSEFVNGSILYYLPSLPALAYMANPLGKGKYQLCKTSNFFEDSNDEKWEPLHEYDTMKEAESTVIKLFKSNYRRKILNI